GGRGAGVGRFFSGGLRPRARPVAAPQVDWRVEGLVPMIAKEPIAASGVMKTLFLNPPSFEGYDGGASSRWPATREIESYWYPVWLAYPAGMLEGSRLLDAPPHHVSVEQTVAIGKDYEFLVLCTSTVGFDNDIKLANAMKEANPKLKICFVGPPVTVHPL